MTFGCEYKINCFKNSFKNTRINVNRELLSNEAKTLN